MLDEAQPESRTLYSLADLAAPSIELLENVFLFLLGDPYATVANADGKPAVRRLRL